MLCGGEPWRKAGIVGFLRDRWLPACLPWQPTSPAWRALYCGVGDVGPQKPILWPSCRFVAGSGRLTSRKVRRIVNRPRMNASDESTLVSGTVPLLYFNGFGTGLGAIDLSLFLLVNQATQLELKMTYTTAKGLAAALQEVVAKYESLSGQAVPIGSDLTKEISRRSQKSLQSVATA